MDTGLGSFAMLSEEKGKELEEKKVSGLFCIGEKISLKGSMFTVTKIKRTKLVLHLEK